MIGAKAGLGGNGTYGVKVIDFKVIFDIKENYFYFYCGCGNDIGHTSPSIPSS